MQNAADIVNRVYSWHVVIADIVARNFLVNKDLSLYDFSESLNISEEGIVDELISDDYLSVKFDTARFGSMMYEIMPGS